ncbi:MAG: hypothetical protein GYA43_11145 [Bacteroidales bacterium]|nr:hypothetical protein [Bacteroidales bacterium]
MRNKINIPESDVTVNQIIRTSEKKGVLFPGLTEKKSRAEIIASEGSEDFLNYVEWLGFASDPNLVVRSSTHHDYYDAEEMKNVRAVVTLIELNQVRDVRDFFSSISGMLETRSHLIGSFIDSQKINRYSLKDTSVKGNAVRDDEEVRNSISSRIPLLNTLYRFLDSKINKHLSGKEVDTLLRESGFRVEDMTELNGITYFCAQKLPAVVK